MDTTGQFALIAKRILRELGVLNASVTARLERLSQEVDSIRSENQRKEQNKDIRPPWLDPILAEYKQSEREKHSSEDRQYRIQSSIRMATWCAFWAVCIYAGITLLIWRANKRAADAAKESADVARDTLVVSNRPWLDIKAQAFGPFTFDDSGGHLPMQIQIDNFGNSPAVRVRQAQQLINAIGNDIVQQEINKVCQQAKDGGGIPIGTVTIFPRIPRHERWTASLGPSEMERKSGPGIGPGMSVINPVFFLCLAYRADFIETEHYVGYAWMVAKGNPQHPNDLNVIVPRLGPVPIEQLVILKEPFMGPWTDQNE